MIAEYLNFTQPSFHAGSFYKGRWRMRYIALALVCLTIMTCGCSSSIAGSNGGPPNTPTVTADASLHQLQSQGALPTLDVSSSLLGTDSDGNGVRDDIDKYIAGLTDNAAQKKALTQLAQALQATLTVDKTSTSALAAVTNSLNRADTCIWRQYTSGQSAKGSAIEALTINTKVRLAAYEQYSAALNGSIIPDVAESTACN